MSRTRSPEWVSTQEMCELLGCTRQHLANLREQEVFKQKRHWINISPLAARPTYRYHSTRCQTALIDLCKRPNWAEE
jgi:hypothetical protein